MRRRFRFVVLTFFSSLQVAAPAQEKVLEPWRHYVFRCLDTLIEHGRDTYGEVKSPLLMAMIDVRTLKAPRRAPPLDKIARLEGRLHRRATGGSNLWYDQKTIKSLYRASQVTRDQKYAKAADAYLAYALKHCYKRRDEKKSIYLNGMLCWGTHIFWNAFTDAPGGDLDGGGPHEILVYQAEWGAMHRVDPDATRRAIDEIWRWHICDKFTGKHNRHDDAGRKGGICDFAFAGGSFATAFAFMHKATGDDHYLDKAKLVAGWHWKHRHPKTNLVPDAPSTGGRYDSRHCFTSVTGPFAAQLLHCFELTKEKSFLDMATTYIKAYDEYGWDEKAKTYYGMLKLDGTPIPHRAKGSGYDAWAPHGHVDVWRINLYSYEFPLVAAQSAVYAYELSKGDEDLLRSAKRWAHVIESNLPARSGRRWKKELEKELPDAKTLSGTYAENYGRAISFFVHLHRATKDSRYLEQATKLAREAVDKLFTNGIFRGHPAKHYYEATNGVGLLLWALLELDAPDERLAGAF